MQSPSIAMYHQRTAASADTIARAATSMQADVPPAAEVVAQEVQDQALTGDLDLLDSLVGKLGAVGPNGSGLKVAVDAALAKAGGNAPQPEAANVQAALATWEASGAPLLAGLLQAIRDLRARSPRPPQQ